MFDKLRDAFREAVNNFHDEMSRDQVPETVDRLLKGMRNEAADTQAHIKRLEQEVEVARRIAQSEANDAKVARRREEMAQKIGDEETARVAAEFALKHENKRDVIQQKAVALEKELQLRKNEVAEMLTKIKEAQKDRDTLAATASRSGARDTIRGAGDLFDELDRMADKIDGEDSEQRANEDVWQSMEDDARGDDVEVDFDARLDQLKRRMSED
jgi:phage shock protein A